MRSKEYKYSVGEIIKKGKTTIKIQKQERDSRGKKRYQYICLCCNQIGNISEYNISDKGCCPVCNGHKIVQNVNDIATKASWMIPFFVDEEITRKKSPGSKDFVWVRCPDCGKIRDTKMRIKTLHRTHSIGCICGDGISYPNKFMFSVLEQLLQKGAIVSFNREFNKEWLEKKRFDFFVMIDDETMVIVEMDGGLGHGNKILDKSQSKEDSIQIDQWKDARAAEQGYKVIRIDATISNREYLEHNIKMGLSDLIDMSVGIDWNQADMFATSNLIRTVSLYYQDNKPMTMRQLASYFNIHEATALTYVKKGEEFGWCQYDWNLYYEKKYSYFNSQTAGREKRIKEICEYYRDNKPILAVDIAKEYGIAVSTVLSYLRDGVKFGYEGYDYTYSREVGKRKFAKVQTHQKQKSITCYDSEHKFVKEYESVKQAAEALGVSATAIVNACKKKTRCKGYYLEYTIR